MIGYVLGRIRIAIDLALRVVGLFGVGLLIGFSGYTASAGSPHLDSPVSVRSVEHTGSRSAVGSEQSQSPHLVAYSLGMFQVFLR
jgi:hypothetical protein